MGSHARCHPSHLPALCEELKAITTVVINGCILRKPFYAFEFEHCSPRTYPEHDLQLGT